MPDYAKLGKEVFERQGEITCQEFRLFCLIVFHSFIDDNGVRICRKTLVEICEIYGLDYDNSSRRYNRLRTGKFSEREKIPKNIEPMKMPWLKKTKDGIIPLVGFRKFEKADFEPKRKKETVINTVVNNNGHKSKFTLEECLEYAENQKGISNPKGWAIKHHRSGESDVFIEKYLSKFQENDENPLDEDLIFLQGIKADGLDLSDYQKFYPKEKWQQLIGQLEEQEKVYESTAKV